MGDNIPPKKPKSVKAELVPGEKKKIHLDEQYYFQKESALTTIFASGHLTASQKKIFNAMIFIGLDAAKSRPEDLIRGISVPVSMLKDLIGDLSTNYTYLRKSIKSLNNYTVETNIFKKDKKKGDEWSFFSLVAGADVKDGILTFSFPHQIVNVLTNPQMYVVLDLKEINQIEKKYSISIYEILKDYTNSPAFPRWSIKEFKRAIDIKEETYPRFKDLHERVIKPSVEEINELFDVGLEYYLYSGLIEIHCSELEANAAPGAKKRGRLPKITHIRFHVKEDKKIQREDYRQFIERMRKECMPDPDNNLFPSVGLIDEKEFLINNDGKLYYIDHQNEGKFKELTPQESGKYWKQLWELEKEKTIADKKENEDA